MPAIRKAIAVFLILVLFVSLIGLFFIYRTLPGYIEDIARQGLLQNTPLTHFEADVRHAGIFGLSIENIEAGEAAHPALSIDSIDIRYSPAGLFNKTIEGIDVAGLTFFLEINDGLLSIPGMDNFPLEKKEKQPPAELIIPVNLNELRIKEGILHITVDNEQIQIPFNLTLRQENSTRQSFYKSFIHIFPGSEQITFAADIDLIHNQGLFKLSSKKLLLEKLAPFLSALPDLKMVGQASLNGISEIRLQPAEVISASIEIGLQQFNLTFNDIKLASPKESTDGKPIRVQIDYQKNKFQYQANYIPLTGPIEAIFDTSGTLELSEEQLSGIGDFKATVKKIPSLTIQEHIQLHGDVTYAYERSSGNWHFNLVKNASSPASDIKAQYQDILIKTGVPDYALSGKGVMESGNVTFSAANQQISVVQDNLRGNGTIILDGSLQFKANGLKGDIKAELQNGRVDFTENDNAVEDISMAVHFPNLPQIETDTRQVLRFGKASFGDLLITDGRVTWQLESSGSLYLENSVFQWAGGNIQVNDTRLIFAKKQQFITILCDQLDLIEILQQLSINNAEGEGTVSGKIPLLLGKNSIHFENGLLSSSQGEGGRIKISAFDLLASGIPKNSPQFSQIDFAAEALKNFKYNWVKLFLNTTGDDLVMQLQMDGHPMQPLPFTYNENGTFSRIDVGGEGIIRPIRLDVNFRFPLNRLLGYSGKIMDIMDKIQ